MTIADTDVLIDFLAGRAGALVHAHLERGDLRTTVITRFELLAGARRPRQLDILQDLLAALPALPLEASAADRAAQVRRDLDLRGEAIGMADSLIAGIVLEAGGALMTRNRRHFARVPGLRIVDPGAA